MSDGYDDDTGAGDDGIPGVGVFVSLAFLLLVLGMAAEFLTRLYYGGPTP